MELIKSAARRTKVSEVVYVLLNALYAALLLGLLIEFEGQPYLSFLVVFLSKWRVFAVRPRFWVSNIRTNMLDTLVGLSTVTLLWQNMGNISYQIVITSLFAIWLIFIKPLSRRMWVIIQGGMTQFVALAALFSVAHMLNIVVVVGLSGLIGFVVSRHIVNMFNDEYEDVVVSAIWGMIVAELGWLTYYWTIAYTPFRIPQISIIASLVGYMVLVFYNYLYHHEDLRYARRDILVPIVFSVLGVLVTLAFFNGFDPMSL